MTAVSIYDDIDPVKKETAAPVSLYDELDINATNAAQSNANPNPSPQIPTTSTSTYPQTNASLKPNVPIIPQIIHNSNTHTSHTAMFPPPPVNEHIDPSLTGVPLQHINAYKSQVLYVGGISWWVTDADLRRTFDQFGTIIDVKVHADKVNGKSKGYGYVEFDVREIEAAVIAKQKLHGHIISDCRISVAFASPERVKGAEYTNTPVHIPRHKINPLTHATVIPNKLSSLSSLRNTVLPHTHTLLGLNRSINPILRTNPNVKSLRNMNANANANVNANINQKNNSNPKANTGSAIGLLSKFTDQAQLLALLNKNRSRSSSDSRSRSRSRSRSKHRRRRHGSRKKRRHDRGERDRDRPHRSDRSDRGEREGREKRRHKRRHRHRDRSDRSERGYERESRRERRGKKRSGDDAAVVEESAAVTAVTDNGDIPVTSISSAKAGNEAGKTVNGDDNE